jgi:hypothetical protein
MFHVISLHVVMCKFIHFNLFKTRVTARYNYFWTTSLSINLGEKYLE